MPRPIPTPYDGSSKLFQIGLKPLDLAEWIDVDERLPAYLDEKERLADEHPDQVFAAEPGTEAAQSEVLGLLVEHLPHRFPGTYQRLASAMEVVPANRVVALGAPSVAPLKIAAGMVQEDLVLMRKGPDGWRLAAAALAFPSSWALREKFGRPMHQIHAPVPGFGEGTRNAELIDRMFNHLRPEMPVIRWNFSLYGDDRLFHPDTADPTKRRFGDGAHAESVFLRAERQTLRKLPASGDILFTIKIYVDPLEALEQHPDAGKIAAALIEQLQELSAEQLDYKGMTLERDRLVVRLHGIAGH